MFRDTRTVDELLNEIRDLQSAMDRLNIQPDREQCTTHSFEGRMQIRYAELQDELKVAECRAY